MTDHKLDLGDTAEAAEPTEVQAVVRKPYRVITEAGLFKNGKQYNKGETIDLDTKTGGNFVEAGDVEAVEEGK